MQKQTLPPEESKSFLHILQTRFAENPRRHMGITWARVQARLEAAPEKLAVLHEMEETGGEPDVVQLDESTDGYLFVDCSAESPKDRRSLCYDREAWLARKANKPESTAMDVATDMGIELLTEEQYHALQELGEFDTKTSSWLSTPAEVRMLGGAIFGDRRFGRVFIYHNGADSYYAARGFRGVLRV